MSQGSRRASRKGEPIDRIASVASFFVSRIDAQIDKKIDARVAAGDARTRGAEGAARQGRDRQRQDGLCNGIWTSSKSDRWQALAAKGAQPQRLLWASTGTKDPAYPDTLYLDTLIGPDTVNTCRPRRWTRSATTAPSRETLTQDVDGARHVLAEAERLGLDLDGVTDTLVEEGVASFAEAFDDLLGAIAAKQPATASLPLSPIVRA